MAKSQHFLRSQATAAAPSPQLKTYAFNIRGYAMEEKPGTRDTHEIICAYQEQGKAFAAIQKALEAGRITTDGLYQLDSTYTNREKGNPEPGVDRYLVVGYTPRVTPDFISQKKVDQLKQRPVGQLAPSDAIAWSTNEPPVLVVTKILPVYTSGVQLFALLMPKHGLCVPHPIAHDLVFYRWEYRDNTTAQRDRGPNWNKKVAEISIQPDVDVAVSEKQDRYKRGKPIARLVFNPNVSIANEIACLAATYQHSKDIKFLQEAMSLIEALDDDIEQRSPMTNTGLRRFVEDEEELDDDVAHDVVSDIRRMWPSVDGVTINKIQFVKKGLLHAEVDLEYGLVRAVVAEACFRLDEDTVWDTGKHEEFIPDIVATIRRITIPTKSTPPYSLENTNAILSAVLAKLKEIMVASAATTCSIKDVFGDCASALDVNSIWGEHADAADTDSSRAAFNQALKVVIGGILQREAGIGGMVEELVDRLEKLPLE